MKIPQHLTADQVLSIINQTIQERQSNLEKAWKDQELSKLSDDQLNKLRDKYAGKDELKTG